MTGFQFRKEPKIQTYINYFVVVVVVALFFVPEIEGGADR